MFYTSYPSTALVEAWRYGKQVIMDPMPGSGMIFPAKLSDALLFGKDSAPIPLIIQTIEEIVEERRNGNG